MTTRRASGRRTLEALHHLFYSQLADGTWSAQVADNSVSTTYSPAVAATTSGSQVLEFAWTNSDDSIGRLQVAGSTSTTEPDVPDAYTVAGPALTETPTGSTLVFVYKGRSSDDLYYRELDGSTWQPQLDQPQAQTPAAPAVAVGGSTLQLMWHVTNTLGIDYSSCGY